MVFNSVSFMVFFPIVLLIYFVVPKKVRYIWLLATSYYFYMSWNAKYALLLLFSTLVTYASGLLIHKINENKTWKPRKKTYCKKWVVAASFIINLLILVYFKYFDFLLGNINGALQMMGMEAINKPFDVLLPVGISFYTFQALSYTIDVYRGDIRAERNVFKYALFVSFFPQLVAGPIERSKTLLTQIRNVYKINLWNYERIVKGFILILWGLFLKMVVADRVAILVDTVFDSYWVYGSVQLILAAVLFAVQIYCDFSSYSTIAIGAANVMGFSLMENFNTPYFSTSVTGFWRRWHISLSTWFRDYLYIPMGGSRCSRGRKYFNQLVTFSVSGLWHGASWNFLIWGALNGVYQIIGDCTKKWKNALTTHFKWKTNTSGYHIGQMLVTFVLIDFSWIFFRITSLSDAVNYIGRIFTQWNFWALFDESLFSLGLPLPEFFIMCGSLVILLVVDLVRYFRKQTLDTYLMNQSLWFRWAVLIVIICSIFVCGVYGPGYDPKQFIYFQF